MTRRLHRIVRESEVEAYFVKKVRQLGGWAYKFVAPGHRGVPDRLVLWPGGGIEFVELKAPGKGPTLQQMREHARIRRLGQAVTVLDSREAIGRAACREGVSATGASLSSNSKVRGW